MPRRPRRANARLILSRPVRAESGTWFAHLQDVIFEIEGHAVTIEAVETQIPVSVQQGTGQRRHNQVSARDRPKRQCADRNGVGKDGADNPFQLYLFAAEKTQFVGDFSG